MTEANFRKSDYDINPLFLERWSPRAFTGQGISQEQLFSLLEAARWAPSSYNSQPWRFVYALRDTPAWEKLLSLLIEFNQSWAKNAAALIIVFSNSVMLPPGAEKAVPSHSHSYDAGAAWAQLALQATYMGLAAHGMAGFDLQRAFAELNASEGYRVEAAIAVGHVGDKSILPEKLQQREIPSPRNPIGSFAFEGRFPQG